MAGFSSTTIDTLNISVCTNQEVMSITEQALGATIDSVDALSTVLDATAASVEETQLMLDQIDLITGQTLPATLISATTSLKTAQQAAGLFDGAIKFT